jgi:glycosyltransferase involved in cell wall biosynthesis
VIIPTNNRSLLLKRAIQSVLDQTYYELECIVVDDASKDKTREMIGSFEDDRLRYFRHERNKGASAARNTGIRHSKGELISFLDDDDEWISTKLEKQVPLLQGLPERFGMVYCWMDYYDANNKLIHKHHPTLKGYVFPRVLDAQRIGGCPTLVVKRSVIDEVGGFDESLPRGNDGDFIRRVCRKFKVEFIPEVLVRVNVGHGNQRISSNNKESIKNAIKGEKIKFSKFHKELNALPEQKSNIYTHIGNHYAALRHFKSAFRYYLKAIIASPKNYKTLIKKMIS